MVSKLYGNSTLLIPKVSLVKIQNMMIQWSTKGKKYEDIRVYKRETVSGGHSCTFPPHTKWTNYPPTFQAHSSPRVPLARVSSSPACTGIDSIIKVHQSAANNNTVLHFVADHEPFEYHFLFPQYPLERGHEEDRYESDMRLSGLQRDVLSLYRKCLRESAKKPEVSHSLSLL